MFNARKLIAAAFAAAIILASCSGDNARREAAQSLLEQARTLVANHHYDSAIVVLDTLDKSYRDCLEQRREGTTVRLTALADLSRDSLASCEVQLQQSQTELARLQPGFKKIDVAGTEGYYVDNATYTGSEMNTTGIQARVDDEGYLFIVANVSGRKIGLCRIEYGGVASGDGESVAIEGSEIMSLSQEKTAELVDALASATAPATVALVGTKGKAQVKLNAKQLASIRDTRDYASALQRTRRLQIMQEKLERQLARLNDQIANQIPVDEEQEQ